ncbi:MAG: hypothetical protein JOZ66_17880 [Hyphomicrobiales bacterium]|nr:hypothetical protein [Hyphomicrobiales bacterium]
MTDASQVPSAPAQSLEPTNAQWRRFARRFVAVFFAELLAVFAFLIAVDPLDSGRFPKLTVSGPIDSVGRVVNVSRGRDPRFNAAIIGNSHLMPLEPKRLSAATGYSFVQLAVPAERKREDAAMISWFQRNHAKIAALVINADATICDRDPALPLTAPFPFWLYDSDLDYVAHMMSASMLRSSARRIKASFGLTPISDPSGTVFEEVKFAFAGPPPPVQPPATDLFPALLADERFPAIDLMEKALDGLPSSTMIVFVVPPAHVSILPQENTPEWREIKTCKHALERRVRAHPNWRLLDYFLDTPAARETSNFVDPNHYRAFFSRMIENDIAGALRKPGTAAVERGEFQHSWN